MPAKHTLDSRNKYFVKFLLVLIHILLVLLTFFVVIYAFGLNGFTNNLIDEQLKNNVNDTSDFDETFDTTTEDLIGPIGPAGPTGEKGEPGEKGDQGPIGKTGPTGPTGVTGPTGSTGNTGSSGPTGATGATGAQGPLGPAGPTGAVGPTGATGAKGEKGDKGDPGTTTFGYRGSFYDTSTQNHSSINTAKAMELNSTASTETNGVSIANNDAGRPTRITVANSGTYNLQFSAQLARTTGHKGTVNAEIWLRKMNANVDLTNTKVTLSGDEDSAKAVAAWNFLIYLEANQFVELMWTVDDLRMEMPSITSGLNGPGIPSLIVTMTQVG